VVENKTRGQVRAKAVQEVPRRVEEEQTITGVTHILDLDHKPGQACAFSRRIVDTLV